MSTHNYLDDLDSLLDNPSSTTKASDSEAIPLTKPLIIGDTAVTTLTTNDALDASQTWAEVIESASSALQEATQLSQEAIRKNIALAKEQQESIKELSDAASGWRHATRQAVQEVNATKKNIIILTVISGLIAIAGFGTTIGVMLQSRTGLVNMSNAVLENVDEHQTIVSKTLTLKMDELSSTIEQMQASIDQLNTNKTSLSAHTPALPNDTEAVQTTTTEVNNNEPQVNPVVTAEAVVPVLTPSPAPAPSPILTNTPSTAATTQPALAPVATANIPTNEAWQQLLTQVDQLQQQLQQIEQNTLKQGQTQNQQWQQLVSQMDEKLATRLAKLPAANNDNNKVPSSVTAVVDTRPIMEQLTRLRQEMAELRLLQQSLKEQIGQVKQSVSESANKPYQYRLPQEAERYPR